ncbi:hypothetical protein DXG03_008917 [Asterophora parasitica]|uniref:Cytochrome P450 n=1 Tax=Asterophora parasitica TaxID=117018 RepID=A0A9P7KFJ4_9AGAR|nr:hypothetical protein DXG03_008917 [Asterophora parasitica]
MDSDDAHEITHAAVIAPLLVVLFIAWLVRLQRRKPELTHIPSIRFSPFPFPYIEALRSLYDAGRVLQEGYQTGFPAFKFAQFTRWTVVITYAELVEELRKAPEEQLSSHDAGIATDQLSLAGIFTEPNHIAFLSTQLTRNLSLVFPELREEMLAAFSDVIRTPDSVSGVLHSHTALPGPRLTIINIEWSISAVDGMTEIISRVCNRGIVGPETFQSLPVPNAYTSSSTPKSNSDGSYPNVQGKLRYAHLPKALQHSYVYSIHPQHDILSLLISDSPPDLHASRSITHTILALNLQAIPSTSLTFTHALYHLATSDAHTVVQPMREEIEAVLRQEGWTLHALEHMRRVDSFLKESMRVSGLHARTYKHARYMLSLFRDNAKQKLNTVTMHRKSDTHYTFSDGTHLPSGTHLGAATLPTHLDATRYPSPDVFDSTRFLRSEGVAPRYQLATTSADFLAWGHGRAACPGRFFAAVVMKMMLAHVVLRYDVRLSGDAEARRPRDVWVGLERLPDLDAEVQFRQRR